jgi:hypothetical protein
MLCVNSYPQNYVDDCRARLESQLAAYQALVAAARANTKTTTSALSAAVQVFEPLFFNNMVVVLEGFFVHRSRTLEKKDGNPLNEVRMLCNSILQHNGVMSADTTIKFSPAKSILKLQVGDAIKVKEAEFIRLSQAFFAEIETKFGTRAVP